MRRALAAIDIAAVRRVSARKNQTAG